MNPLFCAILLFTLLPALSLAQDSPAQDADQKPRRVFLDEFRPKSELKVPQHILQQARFPCVNVHTHPGRLSGDEIDKMVGVMDQSNIAVSVSLDGRVGSFARHYQKLTARHPGRFAVFLRMEYQGEGRKGKPETWDVNQPGFGQQMADHLSEAVKLGASGLKLTKELGLYLRGADGKLVSPDDRRFDPVWQRAGELGVPVLWHCADPIAFFSPIDEKNERIEELTRHPEWSFHGKDFPSHKDLILARRRVINRHPKTTFICAHMGDIPEDLKTLGRQLDQSPNMYVEIAARVSELGRQPYTARKFFLKYADRILFGTDGVPPVSELIPHWRFLETYDENFAYEDNPFPPQGLWNIYGLGLPNDVLEKIYYKNSAKLIPGVASAVDGYATRLAKLPPSPEQFHLFLLVGQSNMAGRGKVTDADRVENARVLTFTKTGTWKPATDPIHFDKSVAGVGIGRTFALEVAKTNPNITIGLIPCAVGGSPISAWQPSAFYSATNSHPYDDTIRRAERALQFGTLKGILWHQGESDSKPELAEVYETKLHELIARLRGTLNSPNVPFIAGQMGQFTERPWNDSKELVDQAHQSLPDHVAHSGFVNSDGLKHKGDKVHFSADSYRELGRRYAERYLKLKSLKK